MTKLICGWCRKEFETPINKGDLGYSKVKCPNCARTLPSSKIVRYNEQTGKKHSHVDYKDGDVA